MSFRNKHCVLTRLWVKSFHIFGRELFLFYRKYLQCCWNRTPLGSKPSLVYLFVCVWPMQAPDQQETSLNYLPNVHQQTMFPECIGLYGCLCLNNSNIQPWSRNRPNILSKKINSTIYLWCFKDEWQAKAKRPNCCLTPFQQRELCALLLCCEEISMNVMEWRWVFNCGI